MWYVHEVVIKWHRVTYCIIIYFYNYYMQLATWKKSQHFTYVVKILHFRNLDQFTQNPLTSKNIKVQMQNVNTLITKLLMTQIDCSSAKPLFHSPQYFYAILYLTEAFVVF